MEKYKAQIKVVSINGLCSLLGFSKQAYYKRMSQIEEKQLHEHMLLEMIRQVRHNMPRLGGRKLLVKLDDKLKSSEMPIGRDAFFDFLRLHRLLIKSRKRHVITTLSAHWLFKYANLLIGLQITRANQVWVCDITYIETEEGFLYLYLITDAYSRKIVGYHLSEDLKAQSAVEALKMAIAATGNCREIIHHSDRGIQYCCQLYVDLLKENKMLSSMTEPASPTQNPVAERLNGILKTEWVYETNYSTKQQAKEHIGQIIYLYNHERPHSSCSMLTPERAHQATEPLVQMWKNYRHKKAPVKGTYQALAVLDVTTENNNTENKKRLPENQATLVQHPSQPLAIPRVVESQQAYRALHQGTANNKLENETKK